MTCGESVFRETAAEKRLVGRSARTIWRPFWAKVRAAARPIPEAEPVMTATRPACRAGCIVLDKGELVVLEE